MVLTAAGSVLVRLRYYRIIGRFHRLRRLIAASRGFAERRRGGPAQGDATRLAGEWAAGIRAKGIHVGPSLDAGTVAAICRYAEAQPCSRPGRADRFLISQVRDGRGPNGVPVAVADVEEPLACPEVLRLSHDPLLRETAARALGYRPRRTRARLYWSPVSDLPAEVRQAHGQTLGFHYDIEACNSVYAYFYLAGGGPESGAHVVVEGSHGPKPFSMIVGSCFQPEAAVLGRYGADKVTVVAGDPGFGFFADPACFHRALAPIRAPRLCLQFRFS